MVSCEEVIKRDADVLLMTTIYYLKQNKGQTTSKCMDMEMNQSLLGGKVN